MVRMVGENSLDFAFGSSSFCALLLDRVEFGLKRLGKQDEAGRETTVARDTACEYREEANCAGLLCLCIATWREKECKQSSLTYVAAEGETSSYLDLAHSEWPIRSESARNGERDEASSGTSSGAPSLSDSPHILHH
jgi:hypothetical protein